MGRRDEYGFHSIAEIRKYAASAISRIFFIAGTDKPQTIFLHFTAFRVDVFRASLIKYESCVFERMNIKNNITNMITKSYR